MINLTMSLVASATLALAALITLGVTVPVATVILFKHARWGLEELKRLFIKVFRLKGKHKIKQGEYGKIRQEEEKPFWPKNLRKIKIRTNLGGDWNKLESKRKRHDTIDDVFIRVKDFYSSEIERSSAVEYTFSDSAFGAPTVFMKFTINKGRRQGWGDRIEKISKLISDIQDYANQHSGEFTEDVCKEFIARAETLSIKDVKIPFKAKRSVEVDCKETINNLNTTFIDDQERYTRQLEAYERLRQQMAEEAAGKQGADDQKCK